MIKLPLNLFLFVILLFGWAAPPASAGPSLFEISLFSPEERPKDRFVDLWERANDQLDRGDLQAAHSLLEELHETELLLGYLSLETYSLELLERSHRMLEQNRVEQAAYLARMAFTLSPDSLTVELAGVSIVRRLGMRTALEQIIILWRSMTRSPDVVIRIFVHLIYPVLWAITLGILVTFVAIIFSECAALYRAFALRWSQGIRSLAVLIILPLMLMGPIWFGPIACVIVWSLLMLLSLPRYRMLTFFAGAVIIAWGFLIPLRENTWLWLQDPGVQKMVRASRGDHVLDVRESLIELTKRRPSDGLVYYTLAQAFRSHKDLEGAERALQQAQAHLPPSPVLLAEKAMLEYYRGNTKKAEELLQGAFDQGLDTVTALYNMSRIKFDLLETEESRELHRQALQDDPELTRILEEREDRLSMRDGEVLSEERAPLQWYLNSALLPIVSAEAQSNVIAESLLRNCTPPIIALIGGILVLLSLLVKDKKSPSPSRYFSRYRRSRLVEILVACLPSGQWVRAGYPLLGFFASTFLILLSFPIVEWPGDSILVFTSLPSLRGWYIIAFCFLAIFVYYAASQLPENEEDL